MANIAEGFERGRPAEFHQYLSVAKASCAELRSHLYVALDAQYLTNEDFNASEIRGRRGWADLGWPARVRSTKTRRITPTTHHSVLITHHCFTAVLGKFPFPSKGNSPNRSSTLR